MKSHLLHGLAAIKGSVLEIMARNMPAADVQFLASKWGLAKSISPATTPKTGLTPEIPKVSDIQKDSAATVEQTMKSAGVTEPSTQTQSRSTHLLHPLLGELVCDLKYKKVYLTSVRALASAPVWQKQRTLRVQRAAMIVKNKQKNSTVSILPGVISMYHDQNTDEIGIFDGQHRAAALVLLAQEGLWNDMERNVTVDLFETNSETEIKTLFSEVNAAEPVKLIDMPTIEDDTIPSEKPGVDVRRIIDEAVAEIAAKYPAMFKVSQNCRPPHVNIDVCRDDIFQSEFISKRGITTSAMLVSAIEEANCELKKVFRTEKKNEAPTTKDKALTKAIANNFFLGLDKAWVHQEPV